MYRNMWVILVSHHLVDQIHNVKSKENRHRALVYLNLSDHRQVASQNVSPIANVHII